MADDLQAQIETYLAHLDGLIRRGRQVREGLATNPAGTAIAATRAWQEDCGVTINQLTGGSKTHWLARSFSEAFLMRSPSGQAREGAAPEEIVDRLVNVLEQAVASLSQKDDGGMIVGSAEAPPPRRFEFVHNSELRPIVEQAYTDSRKALEQGQYDVALRTSSGILEAIVTDALEHKGLAALADSGALSGEIGKGKIADWSFETRLAIAEKAGLIRNGCARLPAAARTYRDHSETGATTTVSERDARQAGQVLRVVMRDLDPGR